MFASDKHGCAVKQHHLIVRSQTNRDWGTTAVPLLLPAVSLNAVISTAYMPAPLRVYQFLSRMPPLFPVKPFQSHPDITAHRLLHFSHFRSL